MKPELLVILENLKKGLEQYKQFKEDLTEYKINEIRTYFKHNARLSHCEDSSFIVRSFLDELHNETEIGDIVEEVDYLIKEFKEVVL